MTTDKDREVAEKYINRLMEESLVIARSGGSWSICPEDSKRDFFAGLQYARTPVKIDRDRPETWPPRDRSQVLIYSDGHFFIQSYKEFHEPSGWDEYWLPIPPLPTVEGKG